MSFLNLFRAKVPDEQDDMRVRDCLNAITEKIADLSGVSQYLRFDKETVAFSGTQENPDLLLEVFIQKYDKKKWLYASLDDEYSWHEWDFQSTDEFSAAIAEFIAPLINHTVKYVTETVRHRSIRTAVYTKANDEEDWTVLEDYTTDHFLVLPFATKTERKETIKVYSI